MAARWLLLCHCHISLDMAVAVPAGILTPNTTTPSTSTSGTTQNKIMLLPPCAMQTTPQTCLSKDDSVLIFDVATNATTPRCNARPDDLNAGPRLVSVAWAFYSATGKKLSCEKFIIQPRDFTIPEESIRFHGVTMARALKRGIPVRLVLRRFANEILNSQPKLVVAHNLDPDIAVLNAEYLRQGLPLPFEGIPTFCTMERTTDLCQLPGRFGGFKWPALCELQLFLFREPLVNCCTTNEKVRALAKIFFELQQLPVDGPWKCIFEKKIL